MAVFRCTHTIELAFRREAELALPTGLTPSQFAPRVVVARVSYRDTAQADRVLLLDAALPKDGADDGVDRPPSASSFAASACGSERCAIVAHVTSTGNAFDCQTSRTRLRPRKRRLQRIGPILDRLKAAMRPLLGRLLGR